MKKLLCVATALSLCAGLFPACAMAAEEKLTLEIRFYKSDDVYSEQTGESIDLNTDYLKLPVKTITLSGTGTVNGCIDVPSNDENGAPRESVTVTIKTGSNVTINGDTDSGRAIGLSLIDDRLVIEKGATLTVNGSIYVGEGYDSGSIIVNGTLNAEDAVGYGVIDITGGGRLEMKDTYFLSYIDNGQSASTVPKIGNGTLHINTKNKNNPADLKPAISLGVDYGIDDQVKKGKRFFEEALARLVDLNKEGYHFGEYTYNGIPYYTLLDRENNPVQDLTLRSIGSPKPVTGVTLEPEALLLAVGGEAALATAVLPANTTLSTAVTWVSNNTGIATVTPESSRANINTATVKGKAIGETTITVTTLSNSFYDKGDDSHVNTFSRTCTVKVVEACTVTCHSNDGSGTTSTFLAPKGRKAALPPCSFPAPSGKAFDRWAIGSADSAERAAAGESYTFAGDGDIYALWKDAPAQPDPPTPSGSARPSGGSKATVYRIKAGDAAHGVVEPSRTRATKGTSVTLAVAPEDGYLLSGLSAVDSRGGEVALAGGDGRYSFAMPAADVTITASFAALPEESPALPCGGGTGCPSLAFSDFGGAGAWYHEAMDFALQNGLMDGYGNGLFGVNEPLSRAQLAQILYNMAGRPVQTQGAPFPDTLAGLWHTPAVTWAAANGILRGYGNGLFGPDDPITREQLAAALWRFAGAPTPGAGLDFRDVGKASGYAVGALCWAVENGLLSGYGDGLLDPQGLATRVQAAQMLKAFMEIQ